MRFDPLPHAAYGSNLWHAQMADRCPGAEVLGAVVLPGWRLVLRKYALVEQADDELKAFYTYEDPLWITAGGKLRPGEGYH